MRGISIERENPAMKQREQFDPPAFMSVPGAAAFVSVSTGTIRRLLERKQLTRYKLRARTLVKVSELLALVRPEHQE